MDVPALVRTLVLGLVVLGCRGTEPTAPQDPPLGTLDLLWTRNPFELFLPEERLTIDGASWTDRLKPTVVYPLGDSAFRVVLGAGDRHVATGLSLEVQLGATPHEDEGRVVEWWTWWHGDRGEPRSVEFIGGRMTWSLDAASHEAILRVHLIGRYRYGPGFTWKSFAGAFRAPMPRTLPLDGPHRRPPAGFEVSRSAGE